MSIFNFYEEMFYMYFSLYGKKLERIEIPRPFFNTLAQEMRDSCVRKYPEGTSLGGYPDEIWFKGVKISPTDSEKITFFRKIEKIQDL